jgi:hypothetical protein
MYTERVYRLQAEFCEISRMLAHPIESELRDQLTERRLEIVAEASDLVHDLEISAPPQRVPARFSPTLEPVSVFSE